MLFNSWIFVAFLVVLLAVVAPMRRYGTPWRVTLLVASYFFYAQWDWRYCFLILGSTIVDYALALGIDAGRHPRRYIVLSVVANLGFLGFFKYANFLLDTAGRVGAAFSLPPFTALDIVLPVGISFFTFQAMSYTIDVYRKELPARRSFLDYALFIAFFPQLLAGPIVRAREFFTQLDNPVRTTFLEARYALVLIALGLVKKMVLADTLALRFDPVWTNAAHASPWEALLAVYAFAFQIYFDFSGYTDVAIGVALLLGFRFPKNFDYPYLALSIQDFWRRWHMTLSRWLRDYLYVALGGNRHGPARTYAALMITMLLGGLWHGASWNFVIWGGLHGAYLALERVLPERWRSPPASRLATALRWLLTFNLVCLAWIFFRSPGLAASGEMLAKVAALPGALPNPGEAARAIAFVAVVLGWQALARRLDLKHAIAARGVAWVACITLALLALAWLTPGKTMPFIYFQF